MTMRLVKTESDPERVEVVVTMEGVKMRADHEAPMPRWRLRLMRLIDRAEQYARHHYREGWNDGMESARPGPRPGSITVAATELREEA